MSGGILEQTPDIRRTTLNERFKRCETKAPTTGHTLVDTLVAAAEPKYSLRISPGYLDVGFKHTVGISRLVEKPIQTVGFTVEGKQRTFPGVHPQRSLRIFKDKK